MSEIRDLLDKIPAKIVNRFKDEFEFHLVKQNKGWLAYYDRGCYWGYSKVAISYGETPEEALKRLLDWVNNRPEDW